ncbi:hypothetical protein QEZ54_28125 [Catellatospora sp. KI3]|uniref:hypothetical protein n=1 Tax=Catellatospora sp. KI3 TaxID=3041620 RepID=UPI002482B599|nr:hypothetical protein [Catellatospora sp. KI3]MDI1464844.1 hypothetical protein [Catellatospora sp. KI3]
MTVSEPVRRIGARLEAVVWGENFVTVPSRQRLMKEYLRRAALWANEYGVEERWPFFDIAECVDPASAVDQEFLEQLMKRLEDREIIGPHHWYVAYMLRFAALTVALPDLADPFEPMLRCYERGGAFGLEGGAVLIGHSYGVQHRPFERFLNCPPLDISDVVLDELDVPWLAKVEKSRARADEQARREQAKKTAPDLDHLRD